MELEQCILHISGIYCPCEAQSAKAEEEQMQMMQISRLGGERPLTDNAAGSDLRENFAAVG